MPLRRFGGRLVGLDCRFKTVESLAEKIKRVRHRFCTMVVVNGVSHSRYFSGATWVSERYEHVFVL
jgi:hypothetical protein